MYCETLSAFTVPGSQKLVNRNSTSPTMTATKLVYLQIKPECAKHVKFTELGEFKENEKKRSMPYL